MGYVLATAFGLHQLATVVWVGGMFFAHMALRPAVSEVVQAPERLRLMLNVFRRFFPWVWAAVLLLWGSGLWVFLAVLQGRAPGHVHLMMGIGTVMTAIFVSIYTLPYVRLRRAVQREDWPSAAASLALIRRLIGINLVLGLIAALAGAAGSYVLAA
jgi:uncharacterized membrane protein